MQAAGVLYQSAAGSPSVPEAVSDSPRAKKIAKSLPSFKAD